MKPMASFMNEHPLKLDRRFFGIEILAEDLLLVLLGKMRPIFRLNDGKEFHAMPKDLRIASTNVLNMQTGSGLIRLTVESDLLPDQFIWNGIIRFIPMDGEETNDCGEDTGDTHLFVEARREK